MTVINTNISANITANSLAKNERAMSQTMERLSTGMRINSAADDAAGLAISQRMTSQVKGLDQAARNANDAISMLQTADGAAIEITNMLQRMRELTVQASSATNTAPDIANMDLEFKALASEIDRIVDSTQWNGENILNGEGGDNGSFTFQIGANDGQSVTVDFSDFNLAAGAGATEGVAAVEQVDQVNFVAAVEQVDFVAAVEQVDQVNFVAAVEQVDFVAAVDQVSYSAEVQQVIGTPEIAQADATGTAGVPAVAAVEAAAATFTQALTDNQADLITSDLVISDGTTSVTIAAADITDLDSIVAAVNGQGLDFEVAKNEDGNGLVMTNSATGPAGATPTVTATLSSGTIASVAVGVTGVDAVAEQMNYAGEIAQYTHAITDAQVAGLTSDFEITDGTTSITIAKEDVSTLENLAAAVQAQGGLDFDVSADANGLVLTAKVAGAIATDPSITATDSGGAVGATQVEANAGVDSIAYIEPADIQASPYQARVDSEIAQYTHAITDAQVAGLTSDFEITDGTTSITIAKEDVSTLENLAAAVQAQGGLDFDVSADANGLVLTAKVAGAIATDPSITATDSGGAVGATQVEANAGVDFVAEQMDYAGEIAQYTHAITDAQVAGLTSDFEITDGTTSITIAKEDVSTLENLAAAVQAQGGLDFDVSADANGLVLTAKVAGAIATDPSITAADSGGAVGATQVEANAGVDSVEGVRFEAYAPAVAFQAAVEGVDYQAEVAEVAYQAEVAFVAGVAEVAEVTGVAGAAEVAEVAGVTEVAGVAAVAGVTEVAAKGPVVMGQNLSGMTATDATITTTTANMIQTLDNAISGVTTQRATFGSVMNRLEYTVDNLANVSQNTSASLSRIADADYAAETTELARTQIIQQAGTAMLSQANQQAQSVLALLK